MNKSLFIDKDLNVDVRKISQWATYGSQLEGAPGKEMNEVEIEGAYQRARLYCGIDEVYFVQADPQTIIEVALPSITCVALVQTHCAFKNLEKDYSLLGLIWFQNDFAFPINKEIQDLIKEVPFRKLCVELEYF